jgi:hypothetical protein
MVEKVLEGLEAKGKVYTEIRPKRWFARGTEH